MGGEHGRFANVITSHNAGMSSSYPVHTPYIHTCVGRRTARSRRRGANRWGSLVGIFDPSISWICHISLSRPTKLLSCIR